MGCYISVGSKVQPDSFNALFESQDTHITWRCSTI